jgi:hypothetical protein
VQMTQKITITLDPKPFRIALETPPACYVRCRPRLLRMYSKTFSCGFLFRLPIIPTDEAGLLRPSRRKSAVVIRKKGR